MPVILVSQDQETEAAVASALASSERLVPDTVCRTIPELLARLEGSPAPAVIVDIDPQPKLFLKEIDPLIAANPRTRFIVLSKEFTNDLVLEAMHAGARHFMVKRGISTDLVPALQRLVAANGTRKPEELGFAVTLLSTSGGCGATTLAINLASEFQHLTSEPVLVVDLDSSYGSAATYLGLRGQYGIADILRSASRIDEELISTTALAHPLDIHLLMSPVTANFSRPAPLALDHLEAALRACRKAYRCTVVDSPRIPMDAAAMLAAGSNFTFLVLQLTVKDIRIAREMIGALVDRGVPSPRILPVVNRYRKRRRMITLEEAQKALGAAPIVISNDFKGAVKAVNFGQPLSKVARRSPLRADIRNLATKIVKSQFARNSNGTTVSA